MKTYHDLMVQITETVQERSVQFYILGIDQGIGRDEIGDDLADTITSALDNLTEMSANGLPTQANHQAMEYLAEMMTLVMAQDNAMRKLTQFPVELRHAFIQYGHDIRKSISMLAHLD